jgi:hypothetical protein
MTPQDMDKWFATIDAEVKLVWVAIIKASDKKLLDCKC